MQGPSAKMIQTDHSLCVFHLERNSQWPVGIGSLGFSTVQFIATAYCEVQHSIYSTDELAAAPDAHMEFVRQDF